LIAPAYYSLAYIAGGSSPAGLLLEAIRHRFAGLGPEMSPEKPRVSHG
jgi:hypothetical protein